MLEEKEAVIKSLEQRLDDLRQQGFKQAQRDQQRIEKLLHELHDKDHGTLQQIKVSSACPQPDRLGMTWLSLMQP